jgi:topoisomerase (DNA) II binding protein 1
VDENSYLICDPPSGIKGSLKEQHNPEISIASTSSQPVPTISVDDSGIKGSLKEQHNPEISIASASFQSVPTISVDDLTLTSQFVPSSLSDAAKNSSTDIVGPSGVPKTNQMQVNCLVAEDSEAENDDLYLSNCRISLVGFDEKEMLRLVMMIRSGGGSRHILLSEKLTHIVLGAPSEE